MAKGYTVIIGGANIDICATPVKKLIYSDSNPGKIELSFGGVARNIAESLSRLGENVRLITAFGDDMFSEALKSSCTNAGIDISDSIVIKDKSSSVYSYITDENGEMRLAVADMELFNSIPGGFIVSKAELINGADACFIDANNTPEVLTELASVCGVPVFADPVSVTKAPRLRSILGRIYMMKPNEAEAAAIMPEAENAAEAGRMITAAGTENVCLSMGERGILYISGDKEIRVPCPGTDIVNTNGAGDAFISGYMFGYLNGYSTNGCIKLGNAAAGMCLASEKSINDGLSGEKLISLAGINRKDMK